MTQHRRLFLKTLGAGVAMVSLPEISPLLNFFQPPGAWSDDLETTLAALLLNERPRGPFIANAKTIITEGNPYKLRGAPSALLRIMDRMGLDRQFSNCMGYSEASQCRPHFKSREDLWRGNSYNFTSFTDVKRPRFDNDVAFAIGGNIDSESNLLRAAGAIQYKDDAAVTLEDVDPDIDIAKDILLTGKVSGAEATQALAFTSKERVDMPGGETAIRYETPVTSSVYIPHARRTSRVRNAVGLLAANTKRDPERIYIADVYA